MPTLQTDPSALLGVLLMAVLAFIAGDFGTLIIRRTLVAIGAIDVPSERSSHRRPTPRGAGIVVVLAGSGATIVSWAAGWMPERFALALLGGGLVVATTGLLDDLRGLRWRHRLLAQFAAASWALYWLGGFPILDLGLARIPIGLLGIPLALLGIVWGTNFFNFMDGIDGIAATEAAFAGVVGGTLLLMAGRLGLAAVALATACAAAGFLRHNWAPARVFLGDVGSTWLGFTLCVIGVAGANSRAVPMMVWGLLLGVFVFDATLTLVRRVRRGFPVHLAHREHAFCRATRWGWSHARVTAAVALLNGALATLAVVAWARRPLILPAVGLGLLLLTLAYLWVEVRYPMDRPPPAPARRLLLPPPKHSRPLGITAPITTPLPSPVPGTPTDDLPLGG